MARYVWQEHRVAGCGRVVAHNDEGLYAVDLVDRRSGKRRFVRPRTAVYALLPSLFLFFILVYAGLVTWLVVRSAWVSFRLPPRRPKPLSGTVFFCESRWSSNRRILPSFLPLIWPAS